MTGTTSSSRSSRSSPSSPSSPLEPPPVQPRIAAQVARFLGLARGTEAQLRDALILVAERHEADYDIARTATNVAGWSALHLRWLDPLEKRYGSLPSERPEKLRGALLGGTRIGGMGILDDLRDLSILGQEAETTWTILFQGAKELHDQELLTVAEDAREHAKRVLRWLRTQIQHAAPETLAVAIAPISEVKASLPKGPNRIANIPDPVWGPLAGGAALAVVAALSLAVGRPLLFPSLGPTAALVATEPANPSSRGWNVIVGHAGGLLAGLVAVAALGVFNAPTLFTDKVLDPGRAVASVIALALTILLGMLARGSHPPAAATTLLVTLGGIRTANDVLNLAVGIVVVAVVGEAVRRVRLQRISPAMRRAPADGKMRDWVTRGEPYRPPA